MNKRWIAVLIVVLGLGMICLIIGVIVALNFVPVRRSSQPFSTFMEEVAVRGSNISAEATETQSFSVTGPAFLKLDNRFGNITIAANPEAGSTIEISAHKTAWGRDQSDAEASLENLKITMTQEKDNVVIQVEEPRIASNQYGQMDSVDFTIQVPVETTFDVTTRSGDIALRGTQGKAFLISDFGDITIADLQGGLVARSRNGNITARRIALLESGFGDVDLQSDFGDLTLEDSTTQKVNLVSKNGAVRMTNVRADGEVDLNSAFGRIDFKSGTAGELKVEAGSGSISLTEVGVEGSVVAHSNFGDISLTQVPASAYDLSTGSGAIVVDTAYGALSAHNDFGDITISGGEEVTLDLKSRSGDISYRGSLGPGPHLLDTEFGNIELSLPEDTAAEIDLETNFGKIQSAFAVQAELSQVDEDHWQGAINGGGPNLQAATRNGNITLEIIRVQDK